MAQVYKVFRTCNAMVQEFVINDNDLDDFVCDFIEEKAERYDEIDPGSHFKMPRRYEKMLATVLLTQVFERTAANRAAIRPGTVHFLQAKRERAERLRRALQRAQQTALAAATDTIESLMLNLIVAVQERLRANSVVARAPMMQRQVGGLRVEPLRL